MSNSKLVWSSEIGSICPKCKKALRKCKCNSQQLSTTNKSSTPKDGIARVSRITKGKKGNGVSVITGLPTGTNLKEISASIKKKCGVGGTVKGDSIEIQSQNRELIVQEIIKAGFKAKIAGG